MAAAYALGNFNDNLFRQGVVVMALAAGLDWPQGWAVIIFSLPFVVFAAPAGWLADRFPKRNVVIAAKALEVLAALVGAAGLLTANWWLMLGMVGLMGLQATVFTPALNGTIPELYPAGYVLKANAHLKVATTAGILLGIFLAGVQLSHAAPGWGATLGKWLLAGTVLAASSAGLVVSLLVPRFPAGNPSARFPWTGPADTVRTLAQAGRDRLLGQVILADAFIWFIATLHVSLTNRMGLRQLGLNEAQTSYLAGAVLAGVAVGGLLCGKLAGSGRWVRLLGPAGLVLALGQALCGQLVLAPQTTLGPAPLVFWLFLSLEAMVGLAGGFWLVSLESFIQARPAADRKGHVIAAANCTAFVGILLSGAAYNGLLALPANQCFFIAAGASALAGLLAMGMKNDLGA